MGKNTKRHVVALVLAGFFLTLALVSVVLRQAGVQNSVNERIKTVVLPLQQRITRGGRTVFSWLAGVIHADELKKEVQMLQQKLIFYEQDIAYAEALQKENQRLRALLEFQQTEDALKMVGCEVVAKNAGSGYLTLQINKGSDHQIACGDVAVFHRALVGKVTEVSQNHATITTILHPQNAVGVLVARTQAMAVLKGDLASVSQNTLQMTQEFSAEQIASGDVFVTTGMGGVYPKGLLVGVVEQTQRATNGGQMQIIVAPAVEFEKLYEVTIIRQGAGG